MLCVEIGHAKEKKEEKKVLTFFFLLLGLSTKMKKKTTSNPKALFDFCDVLVKKNKIIKKCGLT